MKKQILLFSALMIFTAGSAFAKLGIGAAFSYGLNNGTQLPGTAITVSHPDLPGTILGVNVKSDEGNFNLGVFDDWWLRQANLTGMIDYFAGLGLYGNLAVTDNETGLSLGGRIPIGARIFPIEILEIYIEVAPYAGLSTGTDFIETGFQGDFGLRIWL